jgi:hypothetical protein
MPTLTKGELKSRTGKNEFPVYEFTSNGAIAPLDCVQLTTSNTIQVTPADAVEAFGFALSGSDGDGDTVKVAWGGDVSLVMGITGTPASLLYGAYYALAGTTGAQTIDQGDTGHDLLASCVVDTANALARVVIIDSALQMGAKEVAETED